MLKKPTISGAGGGRRGSWQELLPNAWRQIQLMSANSPSPARCDRCAQADMHTHCMCVLTHCCCAFHNHETIKSVPHITSCAICLLLASDSWQERLIFSSKKKKKKSQIFLAYLHVQLPTRAHRRHTCRDGLSLWTCLLLFSCQQHKRVNERRSERRAEEKGREADLSTLMDEVNTCCVLCCCVPDR